MIFRTKLDFLLPTLQLCENHHIDHPKSVFLVEFYVIRHFFDCMMITTRVIVKSMRIWTARRLHQKDNFNKKLFHVPCFNVYCAGFREKVKFFRIRVEESSRSKGTTKETLRERGEGKHSFYEKNKIIKEDYLIKKKEKTLCFSFGLTFFCNRREEIKSRLSVY